MHVRTARGWWGALALVCGLGCGGAATVEVPNSAPSLGPDALVGSEIEVHAVIDLPAGSVPRGASTLSALSFDGQVFYALPDREPRIAKLTPNAGFTAVSLSVATELAPELHAPWDGEGLAHATDGSFYLVTAETAPRLVHVDARGALLEEMSFDPEFAQQAAGNKGIESLALAPSQQHLFYASESALVPDGARASKGAGTTVRLVRQALPSGARTTFAYRTEPLGAGSSGDMGVSAMAALSDDDLLVLERGYQSDFGNTVRVYRVSLHGAASLAVGQALAELTPLPKQLLLDVSALPVPAGVVAKGLQPNPLLDNYEGLALGPRLDGVPSLWLLADDNANSTQVARLLGLRVPGLP